MTTPNPDVDATAVHDVFFSTLAADSGVDEPTVRRVVDALFGGSLGECTITSTVQNGLNITYDPRAGLGGPESELVELPGPVDAAGAKYNVESLLVLDHIADVVVVQRGTVTVVGPWVLAGGDSDDGGGRVDT